MQQRRSVTRENRAGLFIFASAFSRPRSFDKYRNLSLSRIRRKASSAQTTDRVQRFVPSRCGSIAGFSARLESDGAGLRRRCHGKKRVCSLFRRRPLLAVPGRRACIALFELSQTLVRRVLAQESRRASPETLVLQEAPETAPANHRQKSTPERVPILLALLLGRQNGATTPSSVHSGRLLLRLRHQKPSQNQESTQDWRRERSSSAPL